MHTNIGLSMRRLFICLLLCFCVANSFGCFVYNKLKAKDKLNTGARLYNAGQYDKAASLFKEAVDLNPDLVQARMFYATSLRSQVFGSDENSRNIAREAIKTYEELATGSISSQVSSKDKDQSYAFIADLYRKIEDEENSRKWLELRAKLPNQSQNIVAECYYAISVSYWEMTHHITDKYVVSGSVPIKYKSISEWDVADKNNATRFIQEGLKYNSESLASDPEYANAYSYLNLFYREQIKMESDPKKITELTKQAEDAVEKFQELNRKAASEQGG